MSELSVILDEAEVGRLLAERESLRIQRDAVAARMDEIDRALHVSGEARLRANREAGYVVSVRELMEFHLWEQACDMLGLNPWAVSEGLIGETECLTLTLEQARALGLLEGGRP